MGDISGDHVSVAKALYQLDFYLEQIDAPFDIYDLYEEAYRELRGKYYDETWLDHLEDHPHVRESLDENFTLQTIVDALLRTGHEPVVRALMRSFRREQISVTQRFIDGASRQKGRP
ncbi:hypothetical protein [Alicyclobacillus acidocaldarius]|uniref:Uncharacterized protein n=1 Tax=Alicyclobacillus acidocaldarius (strain Tc-4-1) TaxID=1048834 RepID=F8IIK9_ALIAT|nr:hypothetical protein [Alicyclobacillus acidocaldarius]AEJ43341.1 hypothetical protein TC41_1405 [Alicyclobacillus acidocaldarius subsp. acidocaldarius Tc-4-1]